jgi:hypothetical protein
MIKYTLKPFLFSIIIASIFSASSCDTKDDLSKNNPQSIHRLTNEDIITVSQILITKSSEQNTSKNLIIAAPEKPYLEYNNMLAAQNLTIEIDPRTVHILDQTYEENVQYMKDLHLFSDSEIAAVTIFKNELLNTNDFATSIFHFEKAISILPMTNAKSQRFYNFIDGLKAMNAYDPNYFKGTLTAKSNGGLFGTCLSASIGVGIAFVGLATIEVGSFGVATGVCVAGFIWASAEWGKACGGKGKRLYPKAVLEPLEDTSTSANNFLRLDANGDLIVPPITISKTYKVIY